MTLFLSYNLENNDAACSGVHEGVCNKEIPTRGNEDSDIGGVSKASRFTLCPRNDVGISTYPCWSRLLPLNSLHNRGCVTGCSRTVGTEEDVQSCLRL